MISNQTLTTGLLIVNLAVTGLLFLHITHAETLLFKAVHIENQVVDMVVKATN